MSDRWSQPRPTGSLRSDEIRLADMRRDERSLDELDLVKNRTVQAPINPSNKAASRSTEAAADRPTSCKLNDSRKKQTR